MCGWRINVISLVALTLVPVSGVAQGMPPGGTNFQYAIAIDDGANGGKVRGLKYEPDANPVSLAITDHEITFRLKVVPLNGSPTPYQWTWSPGPAQLGQGVTERQLYFPLGTGAAICTGYAWSPGVKLAKCTILVEGAPGPIEVNDDFLVIGGPLKGTASGSFLKTGSLPEQKFQIDTAVPQDASDHAWHAQIFANAGEPVVKEQIPQTILIYWEQLPDGPSLEFDWTIPSYTADPNHPEASQAGWVSVYSLNLKGTAPGGAGTLACRMKATWQDMYGNSHVGEADDTTAFVHGQASYYSNKITVHKPTTIIIGNSTLGNWTVGIEGSHAAKEHYVMLVRNQNGVGIPGVVVQERFPGTVPPNFRVNEFGYWKTRLATTKQYKIWATGWPDHGQFITRTVLDGSFTEFDNLAYIWSTSETSWNTSHQ